MKNYLPFLLFPIFFLLMLLSRAVDGTADAKDASGLPDPVVVEDLKPETTNGARKNLGQGRSVEVALPDAAR